MSAPPRFDGSQMSQNFSQSSTQAFDGSQSSGMSDITAAPSTPAAPAVAAPAPAAPAPATSSIPPAVPGAPERALAVFVERMAAIQQRKKERQKESEEDDARIADLEVRARAAIEASRVADEEVKKLPARMRELVERNKYLVAALDRVRTENMERERAQVQQFIQQTIAYNQRLASSTELPSDPRDLELADEALETLQHSPALTPAQAQQLAREYIQARAAVMQPQQPQPKPQEDQQELMKVQQQLLDARKTLAKLEKKAEEMERSANDLREEMHRQDRARVAQIQEWTREHKRKTDAELAKLQHQYEKLGHEATKHGSAAKASHSSSSSTAAAATAAPAASASRQGSATGRAQTLDPAARDRMIVAGKRTQLSAKPASAATAAHGAGQSKRT